MPSMSPIRAHRESTLKLARELKPIEVYHWLIEYGYYPEAYVLPPCFRVVHRPEKPKAYFKHSKKAFKPERTENVRVHYPKSELTDRTFGIIEPRVHNDIAYHIYRNWKTIVDAMIPKESIVSSYSFPIPIDRRKPGRLYVHVVPR
jgi:hypothetical protein